MRIVLHLEVEREFTEAAQYYESQHPGLGTDFIAAMDEAVADLEQFPHRWRVIEDEVRHGLLRRFPYAFYYWEKSAGEELEILSATANGTRFIGLTATRDFSMWLSCC